MNKRKPSFKNDYLELSHPRILQAFLDSHLDQEPGYGLDRFSLEATKAIQSVIQMPEAKVFYSAGGTQANLTVISSLLIPFQSVISADTGHIFTNESGAIEATGHKVHGLSNIEGKLEISAIEDLLSGLQNKPHQVVPKVVYISNATELGTVYKKAELESLYSFCKANDLLLFIDGARLGQALTAKDCEYEMKDLARLCDVFYIGGTKNGALLGEAIVFSNTALAENFGFHLKQKGGLLAKGRVLGIQFRELFRDSLFFDLARHSNEMAQKIAKTCAEKGIPVLASSTTNQVFPIFSLKDIEKLEENFEFYRWKTLPEEKCAVRLMCSWATREEDVEALCQKIAAL